MVPHTLKKRKLGHLPSEEAPTNTYSPDGVPIAESSSELKASSSEPRVKLQVDQSQAFKQSQANVGARLSMDMHNQDVFQMQVSELIAEVQPNFDVRFSRAEAVLRRVKKVIENLDPRPPLLAADVEKKKVLDGSQIVIPFSTPRPCSDAKFTLAYAKPANVNVIGSAALRTALKGKGPMIIDMAVTMPLHIFQEKDFLNYRYFHKRAYYLACIAAGLVASEEDLELTFDFQNGNSIQPVLLLSSCTENVDALLGKCQIRILLAPQKGAFASEKLSPWKNCVRSTSADSQNTNQPVPGPTPRYNGTLKSEILMGSYLKLLHSTISTTAAFKHACVLFAVWLKQRGFGTSLQSGGFGSFESATVVALLLQGGGSKGKPLFSSGYSGYQLFKACLQFFSSRDLTQEPFFVGGASIANSKQSKIFTPLFFDVIRGHNILFKMSPASYRKLHFEAQSTIRSLAQTSADRFDSCFISRVKDPLFVFDQISIAKLPASWKSTSPTTDESARASDFLQKLYTILSRALGDRARLVYPMMELPLQWPVSAHMPTSSSHEVTIGYSINPEQIDREVDHGPSAEDTKAAVLFRKFWGEKAELRRFKDGSILESLIWSRGSSSASVFEQIVNYSVGMHLGEETAQSIEFVGSEMFHSFLGQRGSMQLCLTPFEPVWTAFEKLQEHIRALEALPLHVRQISAASEGLRYASISSFSRSSIGSQSTPMDLVIQFEGSARWPDDVQAIQQTKIAFLLKLGEQLESSEHSYTTQLGLENETAHLLNKPFLDITNDSASFRLRIHHDRELSLLERQLKDATASPHEREDAASAVSAHKRSYIYGPAHTRVLRTLSTKYPLLSPTIRLTKKWFSSHLLAPHFAPELIELLVVSTFVSPYPFSTPGSLQTGFLRVLSFIARWNWRTDPLIVDTNNEMTSAELEAINTRFEGWRKIDPAMNRVVLFAASNLDPQGIIWTERMPMKVVSVRLTALAKAACALIDAQGFKLDTQALFTPSMTEYDFVIHVDYKFHRSHKLEKPGEVVFKNLQMSKTSQFKMGLDPVHLFVQELEGIYGSSMVLFYDSDATCSIAGLWNPQCGPRSWKVNLSYSTMPTATPGGVEESGVKINKTAILNDIARLGRDIISRIDIQDDKDKLA